ncbi:unnamed protein product [Malus baccata var. baccata]
MSRGKEPRRENDGRTKRRRQRCGDAGGRIDGVEGQKEVRRCMRCRKCRGGWRAEMEGKGGVEDEKIKIF